MGSQTAHGFPYPVGTDLLADGDNAIQALAEAVDLAVFSAPYWRGTYAGGQPWTAAVNIPWTQVENIGGGAYASGVYTVPKAGVYRLVAQVKFNTTTNTAFLLKKNGANVAYGYNQASAAFGGAFLDVTIRAAVGDTFTWQVASGITTQNDAPAENTFAYIHYLRA